MAPPRGAYSWTAASVDIHEELNNNADAASPWSDVSKTRAGLFTWVIRAGGAVPWPREEYGEFYQAAVFIVLKSHGSPHDMHYNLFLWVGKNATTTDYVCGLVQTTGLYKALGGKPTLHREVQGLESDAFNRCFSTVVYWRGGPERSFRCCRLRDRVYTVRLLQLYRPDPARPHRVAREIRCSLRSLDPAYTFLLDVGGTLYLWQGQLTGTEDDVASIAFLERLRAARGGHVTAQMLNEEEKDGHPFFSYMSRDSYTAAGEDEYVDEDAGSSLHRHSLLLAGHGSMQRKHTVNILVQIFYNPKTSNRRKRKSDLSALKEYEFRKVKDGKPTKKDLAEDGMFIFDTGETAWVWFGQKTLPTERLMALQYAHHYLANTSHPCVSVCVVLQEHQHGGFAAATRATVSYSHGGGSSNRHSNGHGNGH